MDWKMRSRWVAVFAVAVLAGTPQFGRAADPGLRVPTWLADRGEGIPTSLFGTYVREKELLFYPFYEYTKYKNYEYSPKDFKVSNSDREFFGKATIHEALIFLAYGFTDSLALEFESAAYTRADFTKDPTDNTAVPSRLRESGLGDTEINLRYRYIKETATRPEVTFFFKAGFPFQKKKLLIGTQGWEFSPGVVLTKGFGSFGTMALRLSTNYSREERKNEFSEYAVDYIKQLNQSWRAVLSIEGDGDEIAGIGELQYRLAKNAVLKLNLGLGLTKKAPDYAPEIGVMFNF